MADYDFAKIEKKLSKYLDEDRFQHTMESCTPVPAWLWYTDMM